jgi:hypothetical protein
MNDQGSRVEVGPITQVQPANSAQAEAPVLPLHAMAQAAGLHAAAHPQVNDIRGLSFRSFAETFVQVALEGWQEVKAVAVAPTREE